MQLALCRLGGRRVTACLGRAQLREQTTTRAPLPAPADRRDATAEKLVSQTEDDRSAVLQSLPRELRDRVARRLLEEEDEERERMLADCIAAIRRRRERRARGRLLAELRAAEARGDALAAEAAQRQLHEYLTEKPRT